MTTPEQIKIAFARFVEIKVSKGRNGEGKQQDYISPVDLQDFWDLGKIRCVYQLTSSLSLIRNKFLKVLSTLVYIDQVYMLGEFIRFGLWDDILPLQHHPRRWPKHLTYRNFFREFYKNQWLFFPLSLPFEDIQYRQVPIQQILPVLSKEQIHRDDDVAVFEIELDPGCSELREKQHPTTFILKTYKYTGKEPNTWRAEYEAYVLLHERKNVKTVVKCYGSFNQGEELNLLLEWANAGNLDDYLKSTPPPRSLSDIVGFWWSVSYILEGFTHVHGAQNDAESSEQISVIIHGDVKPDNILLSRATRSQNVYKFTPKIADYGHSSTTSKGTEIDDPRGRDRHGNQMFCAPESCHHMSTVRRVTNRIGPAADIFSLGALFSVLTVWINFGCDGMLEYTEQRKQALELCPSFNDSGYDACFHDSIKPLKEVYMMHGRVRESLGHDTPVTTKIIALVEQHMLRTAPGDRLPAKQLLSLVRQTLEPFRNNITTDMQAFPLPHNGCLTQASLGSSHLESGTQPPGRMSGSFLATSSTEFGGQGGRKRPHSDSAVCIPYLEVPKESSTQTQGNSVQILQPPEIQSWHTNVSYRSKQHYTSTIPPSDTATPLRSALTISNVLEYRKRFKANQSQDPAVLERIRELQQLRREYVFFLDDSLSMATQRNRVDEAVKALSYLAKRLDPNGIELSFASSVHRAPERYSKTRRLLDVVNRHEYRHVSSLMEDTFQQLVTSHVIPRLERDRETRFTLFIMTDGAWGTDMPNACGVERVVKLLRNHIQLGKSDKSQISLQFIRFGDDADGKRYLQYLDDFGWAEDIADTTHIDGDVRKMFFGSLSPSIDKTKDDI